MENNNKQRIIHNSIAAAMIMSLSVTGLASYPITVSEAAAKPKLEFAKGTFLPGEAKTVTINNVTKKNVKKLTVTSTKKNVVAAKKSGKTAFIVTAKKKAGTATVKVSVTLKNKKKYKLTYAATVEDAKDRKVTVYNADGTQDAVLLRFFADMPNVPYISVREYYSKLSGDKTLKVQKKAENKYLLTAASGDTATVNTDTDTLKADHYEWFSTCRTAAEGDVSKNTSTNGSPYVEALPDVITTEDKPVTLDFAAYNLDLKGDTADIWMPLETAANLFVNAIGSSMFYTGNNVYYANNRTMGNRPFWESHYEYSQDYVARCKDGIIPADLRDYLYNELMFMLDTNYGNPGRCYFADAIREKGFDRALSETDDVTRGLQKLLKSEKLIDYIMGLGILSDILFDGGHTWFNNGTMAAYMWLTGASAETFYMDYYKDLYQYAGRIGYTLQYITTDKNGERSALRGKKAAIGFTDYGYKEEGDTAVYSFDSFHVDKEGWKTYYEKGGDLPMDTYGQLVKSLKKAEESGKIKNFVIDLTTNGGGDEDSLVAVLEMIAGASNIYVSNTKTGRIYMSPFKIDKNLDGKFDEKDDAINYKDKFHYAVLTTKYSFSCANALPCYAKADGIMVIGERSGGGGCATISTALGCGAFCMISRSKMLFDKDGKEVDSGAEPDKVIEVKKDANGKADYSSFYDIPALSGYINDFYSKR